MPTSAVRPRQGRRDDHWDGALIPRDFTEKLHDVAKSAINPGTVARPVITVSTNPRAGSMGSSIAFRWLARFEPMHQVFLGARALLYLDGRADAGLTQALALTGIGLIVGLLLGAVVTRAYDRRGYHRIHGALAATAVDVAGTDAPSAEVSGSGRDGDSVIR